MHLTHQEIMSQYEALEKTIAFVDGLQDDAKRLVGRCRPRLLLFLGSGTSYCLARSLALAAQLCLGIPTLALPAGDLMLHLKRYESALSGAMAVAVSRSGNTSELNAAVERIRDDLGAAVLSLCATEGSKLSAMSDLVVEMPWSFDYSVCQTRTASCLYLAGMRLFAGLADNEPLAAGLERAVAGGPAFLSGAEQALAAAARLPWSRAVVLADAELNGIADEGALAIMQIARRPASSHHLLNLRHGPMPLVGPDTLALAAVADGNQYELALLADVARRGAHLVVYSDIPLDGLPERAVNVSFGRSLPHGARGLPFLLAAQLIAWHRAEACGLNPDAPEGLDPWVML